MPKESLPSNSNPSPNLLDETYSKSNTNHKLLTAIKVLAIIPFVLYISLLAVNSILSENVKKLQVITQRLESTIYLLKPVEKETRSVMMKTDLYRNYLANRPSIQNRVEEFMNQIPPTIQLKKMSLDNTGLKADLITNSSIDVSLFIDSYLKNKEVKNIELQSFTYEGFSKTFEAIFEVHYR